MTALPSPRSSLPAEDRETTWWRATVARDPAFDGVFWYAVRTTGVYCRPSCAARTPLRENVTFHDTRAAAEAAGYRPCKRCHPERDAPGNGHAAAIAAACRMIEEAEEPPTLDALARHAGLSAYHFHRLFKAATGTTPKRYATTHRANRVAEALAGEGSITAAIYEAGYASPSRFYEKARGLLGMSATASKRRGAGEAIRYAVAPCSLGLVLVAATSEGLCAIRFGDEAQVLTADLRRRFAGAAVEEAGPDFAAVVAEVVARIEAPPARWDLPLDIRGTAFQRRVWEALRDIPPGSTASYQEIAARIGRPAAVRAVAGACAANALAVAVPCHRVVRSDGSLSGYAWGVERKAALLDKEGAVTGPRSSGSP